MHCIRVGISSKPTTNNTRFDLYDWPIDVGSQDDPEGLTKAVTQIQNEIQKLMADDNIDPSKIVVGGFSQGGAIALLTCYHPAYNTLPLGGCVGLSAWLTLPEVVSAADDTHKTLIQKIPMFW
jgi:predicted esterase